MIDVIGTFYALSEDPEAQPAPLPGWHVNVTPEVMAEHPELEAYRITPPHMRRVFAGDDPENPTMTVALRFADEAEAQLPDFEAGKLN